MQPLLRYQQYQENWNNKIINDLGEFKKSYPFSRSMEGDGSYQHLHYGDIHSKFKGILDDNTSFPSITVSQDFETIENEDVVFADASEDYKDLGKAVVLWNFSATNLVAGLHTHLFRPSQEIDGRFLMYITQTSSYFNYIRRIGTGVSVLGLSKMNLGQLEIYIPMYEEQQKIADFFTLLDQRIQQQKNKTETLREYKKGLLQKIFSKEIRFKDENGETFPKWELKSFGEISKKVGPKNSESLDFPVYSISNKYGFVLQNEQFNKSRLDGLDKSSYRIVNNGQFSYNPARINVGSIGLSTLNKPVIVSSLYVCFELIDSMCNQFINHYFQTVAFKRAVLRNVEGSVREYLFYDNFSNITIEVPHLSEQIKIADFLSLIDKKIIKEESILNLLIEQKKGFMQQMFI